MKCSVLIALVDEAEIILAEEIRQDIRVELQRLLRRIP